MDLLEAYQAHFQKLLEGYRKRLAAGMIASAEAAALSIQRDAETLSAGAEECYKKALRSAEQYRHPRLRESALQAAEDDLRRAREATERFLEIGLDTIRKNLEASLSRLGK